MKYLIINGSPHKGNSFNAALEFKKNIAELDKEAVFDKIHLNTIDIPFCVGCLNCFEKGEQYCPHKNTAQVTEKINSSDFLIITSPVYSLNLSALLKNYIDHMSYNYHRPRYYTKKALVISSTVGAGAGGVTRYIRDVLKFWGFNRVYRFAFNSTDPKGKEFSASLRGKIAALSPKIVKNLKSGKLDKPSIKRIFFYNAWRAIADVGDDSSIDKLYWQQTGMSETFFYESIPIGLFGKLLGRFSYAVFKKI